MVIGSTPFRVIEGFIRLLTLGPRGFNQGVCKLAWIFII